MIALADVIQSGTPYFDILLMEELWMEADHSTLANASKQAGLYMTEFRQLASRYINRKIRKISILKFGGFFVCFDFPKLTQFRSNFLKFQLLTKMRHF